MDDKTGDDQIKGMIDSLGTARIGKVIYFYEEVKSTNAKAMELALAGEEDGTVILAERQTGGRGRLDRTWSSPEGGLYLSIILRPGIPPEGLVSLPLAMGVGVCTALRKWGLDAWLKWPNDVLVNEKKISGILMESKSSSDVVIVGIGINLNTELDDLEPELRERCVSAWSELGKKCDYYKALADLLTELDRVYEDYLEQGFKGLRGQWLSLASTIHRRVRVEMASGEVTGTAEDIDKEGGLLLRDGRGKTHRVTIGDCIHLAQ